MLENLPLAEVSAMISCTMLLGNTTCNFHSFTHFVIILFISSVVAQFSSVCDVFGVSLDHLLIVPQPYLNLFDHMHISLQLDTFLP